MNSRRRNLYIGLGLTLTALLVFIVAIAISTNQYEHNLIQDGIRVEAQVLDLSKLTTRKGKTKQCFVQLALFEDNTTMNTMLAKPNEDSLDDKLDALFEKHGSKNKPMGDYQSIQVTTSLENFNQLVTGQSVTFVYLKGDPGKGKLLLDLE